MTPTGSPTHTVGGPDTITLGGHDNTQQSLSDQVSIACVWLLWICESKRFVVQDWYYLILEPFHLYVYKNTLLYMYVHARVL